MIVAQLNNTGSFVGRWVHSSSYVASLNVIVTIGGDNGGSLSDVVIFNFTKTKHHDGSVSVITPSSSGSSFTGRAYHSAVAIGGGKIIVTGGCSSNVVFSDIWQLSMSTSSTGN